MTIRPVIGVQSASQTAIRPAASNARSDLQQDHRHVVVLIGVADKRLDLAQDSLAQLVRLEVAVLLHDPAETRLAEQIAVRDSSLR